LLLRGAFTLVGRLGILHLRGDLRSRGLAL